MRQHMSGENERVYRQTTYSPFYDENFIHPRDDTIIPFEQKLSSRDTLLIKKYHSSRLFSFILLIIGTLSLTLLIFVWPILAIIVIPLLGILYYSAIKLYVTIKI